MQPQTIDKRPTPLGGLLRRFLVSHRGGVALPFALMALPVTLMSVAAVDFHRAGMIKAGLQDALDAATLTVGRSTATTPSAVQSLGASSLTANMQAYPNAQLTTDSFVLNGNTVQATAAMTMTPLMASVFGGNLQISATSQVVRAVNKLEIAMVLDNTGSMAGTKISLLKTAASNFVDTLSAAAARSTDPNAVRIALAPFSMTVNVGSTYKTRDLDGHQRRLADQRPDLLQPRQPLHPVHPDGGGLGRLRGEPAIALRRPGHRAHASTPATLFTPYFAPDEPGNSGTSWNGMTWYNNYLSDVTTSNTWSTRQGYVAKYNGKTFVNSGDQRHDRLQVRAQRRLRPCAHRGA